MSKEREEKERREEEFRSLVTEGIGIVGAHAISEAFPDASVGVVIQWSTGDRIPSPPVMDLVIRWLTRQMQNVRR